MMETQLRVVVIGFLSAQRDEIICADGFCDSWFPGLQNSMDSATYAPRLLSDSEIEAELEDYREDMLDREYHAGGRW